MTQRANRVIVAADSSKAGRRGFARICAAEEVDVLVTDPGIDQAQSAALADAGVRVVPA
jgi:DeoR family transcriptional regulator, aga operon transcriptional repressor